MASPLNNTPTNSPKPDFSPLSTGIRTTARVFAALAKRAGISTEELIAASSESGSEPQSPAMQDSPAGTGEARRGTSTPPVEGGKSGREKRRLKAQQVLRKAEVVLADLSRAVAAARHEKQELEKLLADVDQDSAPGLQLALELRQLEMATTVTRLREETVATNHMERAMGLLRFPGTPRTAKKQLEDEMSMAPLVEVFHSLYTEAFGRNAMADFKALHSPVVGLRYSAGVERRPTSQSPIPRSSRPTLSTSTTSKSVGMLSRSAVERLVAVVGTELELTGRPLVGAAFDAAIVGESALEQLAKQLPTLLAVRRDAAAALIESPQSRGLMDAKDQAETRLVFARLKARQALIDAIVAILGALYPESVITDTQKKIVDELGVLAAFKVLFGIVTDRELSAKAKKVKTLKGLSYQDEADNPGRAKFQEMADAYARSLMTQEALHGNFPKIAPDGRFDDNGQPVPGKSFLINNTGRTALISMITFVNDWSKADAAREADQMLGDKDQMHDNPEYALDVVTGFLEPFGVTVNYTSAGGA